MECSEGVGVKRLNNFRRQHIEACIDKCGLFWLWACEFIRHGAYYYSSEGCYSPDFNYSSLNILANSVFTGFFSLLSREPNVFSIRVLSIAFI